MPKFQVDVIYRDMDVDGDGEISTNELKAFVNMKRNKVMTIFVQTVSDFGFWANWIWFIASVLYLIPQYHPDNKALGIACYQVSTCRCSIICFCFMADIRDKL